jgi:hypothetical protein
MEVSPTKKMSKNEKLNALTRLLIYVLILLILFYRSTMWIILCVVVIVLLMIMGKSERTRENFCVDGVCIKKQQCVLPSFDNPMMNPGLIDYYTDPNRPAACDLSDPEIAKQADQLLDYNFFKNVRNPFERNYFYRQFYTVPVTTIPNDQTAFAESLFRQPESCKINPANCYQYEDIRFNRINPALDGAKEVFYRDPFGMLN